MRALKEHGGWAAVNKAYRFTPESTADILHPEGVSTIDLGPGEMVGELGWIELLAHVPETVGLAMSATSGWRGDRIVDYGGLAPGRSPSAAATRRGASATPWPNIFPPSIRKHAAFRCSKWRRSLARILGQIDAVLPRDYARAVDRGAEASKPITPCSIISTDRPRWRSILVKIKRRSHLEK